MTRTIPVTAVILTVVMAGAAQAQTDLIVNGGAEAANGGEWTAVNGMDRGMISTSPGLTVAPFLGTWMWDAGTVAVGSDGTASLTQTVDVSGCNPHGRYNGYFNRTTTVMDC